jgi:hypothetical protein
MEARRDQDLKTVRPDPRLRRLMGPEQPGTVRRGHKAALESSAASGAPVLQWIRPFFADPQ